MKKGLILLVLVALGIGACADTNSRARNQNSIIGLANTCAACGATVPDNYFFDSNARAIGPGNY